ncbi:complement factor B-like [Centroberyx affinis]|uniref:complement factor B-like n=1 Tax=Centroberyx affinis TaxID=166261 RepID=UPI003A5BE52B
MGFSVHWSCFAVLLCLLCMGGGVRCNCTDDNMQIEGGHYTLTKQLMSGSTLIYHCPEGFYPYPTLSRLCQPTKIWKPLPKRYLHQTCKMIECPDPNVLEYGNVFPPQERYYVNNETRFECYSGYTLRGSTTRVCLPNGKWTGATPICSRDTGDHCADPGIPAGAGRSGNIFGIDDTVKYSCNDNLYLVGSNERVCQENGQWTGTEPACYYRHTYDTPLEVSEAFGSSIINSLTTLESTEDTQEGRKIRITKNGTLNIYIAVDISESIEKDQIVKAKDAVTKLLTKISSFAVSPNYDIIFFSSELFEIANIINFFGGNKKSLQSILDELEKFNIDERDNAGTDLNLAFTTFLERIAVIKQQAGDGFKDHHHVLIFFTDGGYNMGGSPSPTVAKIKNLVYMNHTGAANQQTREEFLDIYIFGIGVDIYDDDLQPLTTGTGGKHYFRLKAIDNLQETFDEIIDEEDVKGLCGLHKEYDDQTKESKQKMYPWAAQITNRKCMGSLVTPKFVLTAAHCFKFEDLPTDVQVDINDGRGLVKKVKDFKLHPDYNVDAKKNEGVDEFYDYDVALIELEEYVKISTDVRPICIPCTKETSEALKLVGESTCKEQEQLLLKTHLEELSFLTKNPKIEQKDVLAKLGDNRNECIGHALKAKGITTKDPTVAVTENFLCTGGRSPRRDHIACTGDSGGAVFKNYEHRTIQIGTVSWGTKNLCKAGGVVESDDASRDFHINLFRVVPFLKAVLGNDTQNDYAPLQFLED